MRVSLALPFRCLGYTYDFSLFEGTAGICHRHCRGTYFAIDGEMTVFCCAAYAEGVNVRGVSIVGTAVAVDATVSRSPDVENAFSLPTLKPRNTCAVEICFGALSRTAIPPLDYVFQIIHISHHCPGQRANTWGIPLFTFFARELMLFAQRRWFCGNFNKFTEIWGLLQVSLYTTNSDFSEKCRNQKTTWTMSDIEDTAQVIPWSSSDMCSGDPLVVGVLLEVF